MRILQKVHDLTRRKAVFASFFNTVSLNLNALNPEMFKLCYSKQDHILSLQILVSSMNDLIETLKMNWDFGFGNRSQIELDWVR